MTVVNPRQLLEIAGPINRTSMRFLAVSVGAFTLDLLLALLLRETFHMPVSVSAAISFIVIGLGVYFLHEHWTFQRSESRTSAGRLVRNLVANGAALTTRISLIAVLEWIQNPTTPLAAAIYISTGAAASLTVNYILNRFWVFSGKSGK
jgi:putative flippase GtrA